jgi:transcriptional regulator with XRE-family HTH domain
MVFGRGRDQQRAEAKVDEEMHVLVTQLTNEITFHMRECGINRAELAARMGVSPGRISQILGGGENLTLRTLAALATALDARFDFELSSLKTPDAYTSRGPSRRGPRTTTPSPGRSIPRAPPPVARPAAVRPAPRRQIVLSS